MRNDSDDDEVIRKAFFEVDDRDDGRDRLDPRGHFADADSASDEEGREPLPDGGSVEKDADEDAPTLDVGDPSGRFTSDGKADRAFPVEKSDEVDSEFVGHDAEVPDPDEEAVEKSVGGALEGADPQGSFRSREVRLLADIKALLADGTDAETAVEKAVEQVEQDGDAEPEMPVVVDVLKEATDVLDTVEDLDPDDEEAWAAVKERLDDLTDRAADAPEPETPGEEALWDAVSERATAIQQAVSEGSA